MGSHYLLAEIKFSESHYLLQLRKRHPKFYGVLFYDKRFSAHYATYRWNVDGRWLVYQRKYIKTSSNLLAT